MDSRNPPAGDDWNDLSMFSSSHFDDSIPIDDSPFGTSAFNDFTNLDSYGDSPMGFAVRTPSKSGPDGAAAATTAAAAAAAAAARSHHNDPHMMVANSADTSSQDSSSDSSSRRKRKNASESPISDPVDAAAPKPPQVKQEMDLKPNIGDTFALRQPDHNFVQPVHNNPSLDQGLKQADRGMANFDFNSAASSPIGAGDFNTAMSLDAKVNIPTASVAAQLRQESPMQTINPGMFAIGSRDQSPAGNGMMFNQASPNAIFSTPSSDSPDAFNNSHSNSNNNHASWNAALQNPSWTGDFNNQLTSPNDAMSFTPSPAANGATPSASTRTKAVPAGLSPLHIAPISTKSRVETQINVVMTLEQPPLGVEYLHLPLHTIAKSKLLSKEEHDATKILELHTMLVCTSAMHSKEFKEKALERAAAQNNQEIQQRAELARETADEEKNDMKNVDEADKPANGGEVRICNNCIQRERKRAGRKKTKREEEQQHWERFETERVVVFNSNEYLPFKPCDPSQYPHREVGTSGDNEPYIPPHGAVNVTAAMRIACYCRHQSEKEGFQVIFTLKDHEGNVAAQQISDSILITDDHKTHPQSFSTTMAGDSFYQDPSYASNGLPMSHSMVDMTTHVQPFTSSRSAGNLQALAYGQQFNTHSHIHQLPGSGYTSQNTSATMTPTSLSRPGSPSSAGQSGPNKKRKSASIHRRVPSGLTMTPRVDTNQPPASNMPSAMSLSSQFSPTNSGFANPMSQPFMTIPNHGNSAQFFGSGPPTPNDSGPFSFNQTQSDMTRMSNNQAYFSHPSSAVPSRASSPVLQQGRGNMAAYARQQPIQTPTNSLNARSAMFAGPGAPGSTGNDATLTQYPTISRTTPTEGPVTGGTEVAVFGENFVMGVQIIFGDHVAPTTFLSPTSLIAVAPPGRVGAVQLSILPAPGSAPCPQPPSKPIYRYTQNNEEMMVMALKFLTQQQFGNSEGWQSFAQQSATSFVQSNINRAGLQQGYPGGHRMAAEPVVLEELMLKIFDVVDLSESPQQPWYDMPSESDATMLLLASALGMHRVVAALLARGANAEVRDRGGYTPLMHAALHGRVNIFQLLLARGADPTTRSLTGCSAIDLVPLVRRDEFIQTLLNTKRRRNSRPTLRSRPSYDSTTSSKASWDISSASYYESEVELSEKSLHSTAASRRPSIQAKILEEELQEKISHSLRPHLLGALRNALASHLLQVHERLYGRWPNFHLPQLPLARHPKFWDVFSCASTSTPSGSPPPAYYDIFPEHRSASTDSIAKQTACVDVKRVPAHENACSQISKTMDCSSTIPWLWISALVFSTSLLMHALMPYISTLPMRVMASVCEEPLAVQAR